MNLPFNLEKALAGEPVVTRDGRRVTGIRFAAHFDYPVSGVIDSIDFLYTWTKKGTIFRGIKNHRHDLFMLNTTPDDNNPR